MKTEAERLVETIRKLKKCLASGQRKEPEACRATIERRDNADVDYSQVRDELRATAKIVNSPVHSVPTRIETLMQERRTLEQQVSQLEERKEVSADDLLSQALVLGDVRVVACTLDSFNANQLRQLIDQIRKQDGSSATLLASSVDGKKVTLVAGLTRDLVERGLSAGEWIKQVAPIVGGGGGGKPDMAQAGGKDASKLDDAISHARATIEKMLA